jgi:ABC-type Fe3+/spermidine/putrescine transport system ATPase subunit
LVRARWAGCRVSEASAPDLELADVDKDFGGLNVVRGATFALSRGEFLSLLGPSGCGKTTTLSMIAGFEVPTRGEIRIRGRRVNELFPERRDIGMVFQNYALFPHMSVAENIGFGLRMRKVGAPERKARVEEAARLVKVDHLLERRPSKLSGGQQQRVALARALIVRPALLLLDEPFGALDRLLREELQVEVRLLLQRLKITTVFVTHDQEEALTMSDRVAVMSGGVIEQIASPQELYDRPATRFVAGFIGKSTIVEGSIDSATRRFISPTGTWQLPPTEAAAADGPASYAIRPEAVRLSPQPGTFANEVVGTAVQATFLGDHWSLIADCGGAARLLISLDRGGEIPAPGSPVRFGWNTQDAAVYQQERRL